MDDDEEAFLELAGQPDGHEGLAVAARNADQTVLGSQTVVRAKEGVNNRQLFWSQSLVELELGPERLAGSAGITIRWPTVGDAPEPRHIPARWALIEDGEGLNTGGELGGDLRLHCQCLAHLSGLLGGQAILTNRVSTVAEDARIGCGV